MTHSNTTPETSQSLASLTASERPLAPQSLYFSAAPVCPFVRNLYSAHSPAPGILPECTSSPTDPSMDTVALPFSPAPIVPSRLRSDRILSLVPAPTCDSTAPDPVKNPYSAFQSASAAVLTMVDLVVHCATVYGDSIFVAPHCGIFHQVLTMKKSSDLKHKCLI